MGSTPPPEEPGRTVSLLGATIVGVGAIVGGGILVLAGVALRTTGPSAIVAFALNGVVAVLTALSFAEMSASFPESGGAYTFAKKVLTVRAAFAVGWVLWFAYIVAGVLYALGFAEYAAAAIDDLWSALIGAPPEWLRSRATLVSLALIASAGYALSLIRKASGGGQAETIGKMVLFVFLIAAGLWTLGFSVEGTIVRGMTPFFENGAPGLLSAMGFTFIAMQGFDLVSAIGGEVKQPARNIPRAMLISIAIGVVIYLPLLFVVATVGVSGGEGIAAMSARSPATVMADAAREFAGPAGYWMVVAAAILSTLSALSANLYAASRVALSMARDRTLPRVIAKEHATRKTPVMAIYASALALTGILLMLPDVAAAGAAASLIFLVTFALVHWMAYLARKRAAEPGPFVTPLFPLVPLTGGVACAALAIFQAFAVPAAGAIAVVWLGLGVMLYYALFAGSAQAVDAFAEAHDPQLAKLRGKHPLVLVPVANPTSAAGLIALANAMTPPVVGRVVLLTVLRTKDTKPIGGEELPAALVDAQSVVREALTTSFAGGRAPETLITVADDPWAEMSRAAESRGCESMLVGVAVDQPQSAARLEALLNEVECDVVVLHAKKARWSPHGIGRVIVPIRGKGGHEELRARLLGSLGRVSKKPVRFVRVVPEATPEEERASLAEELRAFAEEETRDQPEAEVIASDDVVCALAGAAGPGDVLILELQRRKGRRLLGEIALRIARETEAAVLMISRHG